MIARYETDELRQLFSDEHRFDVWIAVERTVAEVQQTMGIIPRTNLARSLRKVHVTPTRVCELEKKTRHDVIAFLEAVREQLGTEGRWLHFGMTSYDLVDTAGALLLVQACDVVIREVAHLRAILRRLVRRYHDTPQIGRTHGMYAQPITFGRKVASWREEIERSDRRLADARATVGYGKLSGAVGSYATLPPIVERRVMKRLGLRPEPVSTQVVPRDRHASLVCALAIHGCALERIATEIRHLSRSEVGEVAEPFARDQKGSSAMPHKQNPILCERICGMNRVLRGMVIPALENIVLWHERDITNSSAERMIIVDAFHIAHYATRLLVGVLSGLRVSEERMRENLDRSLGLYASQRLMTELIGRGMAHAPAYDLVQRLCFAAIRGQRPLEQVCREEPRVTKHLSPETLRAVFRIDWFLRNLTRRPARRR